MSLRCKVLAVCALFVAGPISLGDSRQASAADFYLHSSGCDMTFSCPLSCDRIPVEKLWKPEDGDTPVLAPGKALRLARRAVESVGPEYYDLAGYSIHLTRCGEGWVYVVSFSVNIICGSNDPDDFGAVAVGVLVDGSTFLPDRKNSEQSECVHIGTSTENSSPDSPS